MAGQLMEGLVGVAMHLLCSRHVLICFVVQGGLSSLGLLLMTRIVRAIGPLERRKIKKLAFLS